MVRFIFLFVIQWSWAGTPAVKKNLRVDWMQVTEKNYVPIRDSLEARMLTIYFPINADRYKGLHLLVRCPEKWQLFVHGKLIYSGVGESMFSLDTLSNEFRKELFFGIYVASGIRNVTTQIVLINGGMPEASHAILARPPTYFMDYGIIGSVCLLVYFLLLYRTNPQLTIDYFSFSKIFSTMERNENQLASRITSSVNLLFYLFCALLTGFLLSAIFYSSGPFFQAARSIQIITLGSAFGAWTKLSAFILILLASKLIIVLVFSTLFNFRETLSFQFFNFLRFVLFTGVSMALLSFVYFVFRVDEAVFYERLILVGLFLLSMGSVVVWAKLLGRARISFFQLFSYLCVSEIIPLVIIIKIFF